MHHYIMLQYIRDAIYFIIDLLSPEDKKIKRWLKLDPGELACRLPKPRPIDTSLVSALFDYRDDKVRALVRAIKYRGNREVIKRIAGYFYEEIIELVSDMALFEVGREIIIVPMPISDERRAERGWSQCDLLCREIEKMCDKDITVRFDILKKVKDTKKQTDLKREERQSNVKGSMKASLTENSKLKIENCIFIVIDDVYTTGATFSEAKRALKEAEAKKVLGFFLAH